MPRQARILPPSAMLHIICRGNNATKVARNRDDFLTLSRCIRRHLRTPGIFIHHYALMHTHFHLQAYVEDTDMLGSAIKSSLLSYNQHFSKKYGHKGHVWHGRYRSIVIDSESHWLQSGRYIELNPVHAGLCQRPWEYKWSSFNHYYKKTPDVLLDPICYLDGRGKIDKRYIDDRYAEFVIAGIDHDYQRLRKKFKDE